MYLEHDESQGDADHRVGHGKDFTEHCGGCGVAVTYQGQSHKSVVERPRKLPLWASFVRLLLLYEDFHHLVVVLVHLVLQLELLPQLDQALLDLLVVWSLQSIKDGRPHQEVGEGDDYEGESSDLSNNNISLTLHSVLSEYSRFSSSSCGEM